MASTIAASASSRDVSVESIASAARTARSRLGGANPAYGFLFLSPSGDLSAALRTVQSAAGTPDILGCTTAGELTERGPTHGGAALMLVAGDATVRTSFATGAKVAPGPRGAALMQGLADTRRAAGLRDHRHATSVLLTDGLTGTAERLLEAMYEARVQSASQVVGGAAADESAFQATPVGIGEDVGLDAAAVMHIFGAKPWGVGVGHGLEPTTRQMRVTRAVENVVYEIEGEPAFDVYVKHAASRGVHLTHANAQAYMLAYELGIHFFDRVSRARVPLSVGPDGSLVCAAEVPQGSMVSILSGDPAKMLAAARRAAFDARAQLGGARPAGVLLFDCACRAAILGDAFGEEIEAVRAVFGDVPLVGFNTYGEIARLPGHLDGWHNSTVVVAAIPA